MEPCAVCGSMEKAPVRKLTPVDATGSLSLCRDCLRRRQVAYWSAPIGGRSVEEAVRTRPAPERFSYLRDGDGDVHLVRLRSHWVHQHTVEARSHAGPARSHAGTAAPAGPPRQGPLRPL